jgi:hypothetical protein
MANTARVVQIDMGVEWETGVPMPQLMVGLRTFVLFYARVDKDELGTDRTGLIEIIGCEAVRWGPPDGEPSTLGPWIELLRCS